MNHFSALIISTTNFECAAFVSAHWNWCLQFQAKHTRCVWLARSHICLRECAGWAMIQHVVCKYSGKQVRQADDVADKPIFHFFFCSSPFLLVRRQQTIIDNLYSLIVWLIQNEAISSTINDSTRIDVCALLFSKRIQLICLNLPKIPCAVYFIVVFFSHFFSLVS